MDGLGLLRGLAVTIKHFFETYLEDIKGKRKKYYTKEGIEERTSADVKGIFTVQYPEEKLPIPEEFRYIPFLVYDEMPDGMKKIRCTSCGICAKVCPPQCIWITRSIDPVTGRPSPVLAEFYIDVDICMNCGFCAEYCPFDAIIMDHDFEIASYDRISDHIYKIDKLLKPASYYASIRPLNYAKQQVLKAEKQVKSTSSG
jgi:NADH-quinone oxidoreductase subunit I